MDRSGPVEARASAPSMVSEANDAAPTRAEMHIEPSVIEGRQRIVIKHFSMLKNEVTEEFDSPEKFTLCGEEFNLRLYPGGFNDESRNYLGFYLKSHGNKQLWLAKSDYRIVNQKARPQMASADDDSGGHGIAARTLPDEVRPSCMRSLVFSHTRGYPTPVVEDLCNAGTNATQVKAYDSPAQLAPGKLYGYSMFIRRDKLLNEENGLCVNDTVIFETALTVISSWHTTSGEDGDSRDGASTRNAIAVQPPSWSRDMEALLAGAQQHGDLTIHILKKPQNGSHPSLHAHSVSHTSYCVSEDGPASSTCPYSGRFRAHRAILMARSSVFRAMLDSSGMSEARGNEVTLAEELSIEPVVFAELLHFLYTDTCPQILDGDDASPEMAQHLLDAADKFDCPRLRSMCERHLGQNIGVESVCDTYMLAQATHSSLLADRCKGFIADHAEDIVGTDGYQVLLQRADASQILTDLWLHDRSLPGCRSRSLGSRRGGNHVAAAGLEAKNGHRASVRKQRHVHQGQRRHHSHPVQQLHQPGTSGQPLENQHRRIDNSGSSEVTGSFSSEVPATAADDPPASSAGGGRCVSSPRPSDAHVDPGPTETFAPTASGATGTSGGAEHFWNTQSNTDACPGGVRPPHVYLQRSRAAAIQSAGYSAQLSPSPSVSVETVNRTDAGCAVGQASGAAFDKAQEQQCSIRQGPGTKPPGTSGEQELHAKRSTKRLRTSA